VSPPSTEAVVFVVFIVFVVFVVFVVVGVVVVDDGGVGVGEPESPSDP
jgi:hypothetical protein